jgi:predicted ATPase/DNA-binding XRE family transcriptional regulator
LAEVSFGEWLKRQRKVRGLTQQELALQMNCSTSALRKMEAEERSPSAQIVERLAEIFKIPQDERLQFMHFARGDWRAAPSEVLEQSPWRASTQSSRSAIPAPATALLGREYELAHLREYLSNPGVRLVTLIGPPGIGKTRLGVEIARLVLSDFYDGVFFIPLAALNDVNLLATTIIQTLGFMQAGRKAPMERLKEGIGEKQMLLVLDNLEHLVEGAAPLISSLLFACPHLKILTTSREALRVPGEWLYTVPALEVPEESSTVDGASISKFPALALFSERARAMRSDFIVNNDNVQTVTAICKQLDGLPLAIELIAARIRFMSPESLFLRLSDQFTLYADGMRAIPTRQKTLYNAISWSYNLLSTDEQRLFAGLSVFLGGFTLEAAEAIFSRMTTEKSVTDLIASLLDKSLLQHMPDQQAEPRFHLLFTIQQFALEQLQQAGAESELRDWHLAYFLDLAENADKHMHDSAQLEWIKRIENEVDNFRAALLWAMDKPSAELALRLASALEAFWFMRASWLKAAEWLDQALRKATDKGNHSEKVARARALYHRANTADVLDEMQVMKTSAEAALALCEELQDQWGIAYSRALVGLSLSRTGKPHMSRPLFEKSLDEFHQLGDAWAESRVAGWLSGVLLLLGTPEEYLAMRRRVMDCARLSGDRERLGGALLGSVSVSMGQGNWEQAEKMLQEAEQLFMEVGTTFRMSEMRLFRASILCGHGDYQQAKEEAQELVAYCLRVGDKYTQAQALNFLTTLAEVEKDLPRAIEYAQRSTDLLREVGTPQYIAMNLILGRLHYQQGEGEQAKQHLKDSLQLSKSKNVEPFWRMGDSILRQLGALFAEKTPQIAIQFFALAATITRTRPDDEWDAFHALLYRHFLSTARAKLSEEQFTAAWEAGSQMNPKEAVDLA